MPIRTRFLCATLLTASLLGAACAPAGSSIPMIIHPPIDGVGGDRLLVHGDALYLLAGGRLQVVQRNSGIDAALVTERTLPRGEGGFEVRGALAVEGNVLFAFTDVARAAYDVTNPLDPVELFVASDLGANAAVGIGGDRLVVLGVRLELYDVSDPTAWTLIGGFNTGGSVAYGALAHDPATNMVFIGNVQMFDPAATMNDQIWPVASGPPNDTPASRGGVVTLVGVHEGHVLVCEHGTGFVHGLSRQRFAAPSTLSTTATQIGETTWCAGRSFDGSAYLTIQGGAQPELGSFVRVDLETGAQEGAVDNQGYPATLRGPLSDVASDGTHLYVTGSEGTVVVGGGP